MTLLRTELCLALNNNPLTTRSGPRRPPPRAWNFEECLE